MDFKHILFEKKDSVGKITVNHPPLNYIGLETLQEMNSALADLSTDGSVKIVTITGAGNKAFSAGIEVADHLGDRLNPTLGEFHRLFQSLVDAQGGPGGFPGCPDLLPILCKHFYQRFSGIHC